MPERNLCNLCPIANSCMDRYVPNEENESNINTFSTVFYNAYIQPLQLVNLTDNRWNVYEPEQTDAIRRTVELTNWLTKSSNHHIGYSYFLEYLLSQLFNQMFEQKKIHNAKARMTPTQLDYVHRKDGEGGDVIVMQENMPIALIDISTAPKKGGTKLIHKPTGVPVVQFSLKQIRVEDGVCNNNISHMFERLFRKSISDGICTRNNQFHLPQNFLDLVRGAFATQMILSGQQSLSKLTDGKYENKTIHAMSRYVDLVKKIF
jgi:hypothetical protein